QIGVSAGPDEHPGRAVEAQHLGEAAGVHHAGVGPVDLQLEEVLGRQRLGGEGGGGAPGVGALPDPQRQGRGLLDEDVEDVAVGGRERHLDAAAHRPVPGAHHPGPAVAGVGGAVDAVEAEGGVLQVEVVACHLEIGGRVVDGDAAGAPAVAAVGGLVDAAVPVV